MLVSGCDESPTRSFFGAGLLSDNPASLSARFFSAFFPLQPFLLFALLHPFALLWGLYYVFTGSVGFLSARD